MDLVREIDGRHVNFSDVERYLVKDSRTYFGDFLKFTIAAEYDEWRNFPENLRDVSSAPLPSKLYEGDLNDPERAADHARKVYKIYLMSSSIHNRIEKLPDGVRAVFWRALRAHGGIMPVSELDGDEFEVVQFVGGG